VVTGRTQPDAGQRLWASRDSSALGLRAANTAWGLNSRSCTLYCIIWPLSGTRIDGYRICIHCATVLSAGNNSFASVATERQSQVATEVIDRLWWQHRKTVGRNISDLPYVTWPPGPLIDADSRSVLVLRWLIIFAVHIIIFNVIPILTRVARRTGKERGLVSGQWSPSLLSPCAAWSEHFDIDADRRSVFSHYVMRPKRTDVWRHRDVVRLSCRNFTAPRSRVLLLM